MATLPAYGKSVFFNCPFDDAYRPLFRAAVFTVMTCGFIPRCSLEVIDSGLIRIQKIMNIIESCKFGLHDISRAELDKINKLPRFNMPLELGLFLGCMRYGGSTQQDKRCLILDKEQHRYLKFISDIGGQDINCHNNDEEVIIKRIRDWLHDHGNSNKTLGGAAIFRHYQKFEIALPKICKKLGHSTTDLPFKDLTHIIREWSKANKKQKA